MSLGMIKSCKIKNELRKKMKQNPDNHNNWTDNNRCKNKLLVLIRKAKDIYYIDKMNNITNNTKKLWQFVNKKIDKNTKTKVIS